MRSPNRFTLLVGKELRLLLASRAYLAVCLMLTLISGYGFAQAITLFSEASRSALEHPELAPGMNPFEGVLVPTFGSLYLFTTLLFPFVAILTTAGEIERGTMKLMLQLRVSTVKLVAVKAFAVCAAWLLAITPLLVAVVIWVVAGGHVHGPELCNLVLGHALYAFVIVGASFAIGVVIPSVSTAAIFVLGLTLGSWVLDFSASTESTGLVHALSRLSLTASLRPYERGLFSADLAIRQVLTGAGLLWLASELVNRGRKVSQRAKRAVGILAATAAACALASFTPFFCDVSEDKRNSFTDTDARLLAQMPGRLEILVYLTPDDPRYRDLERQLYSKLRRTLRHVDVRLMDTGKAALFGVGGDENYGLNRYSYEGKSETSRSTSPKEILPLIHSLAGKNVAPQPSPFYSGYPLMLPSDGIKAAYFAIFGLFFMGIWWGAYRSPTHRIWR